MIVVFSVKHVFSCFFENFLFFFEPEMYIREREIRVGVEKKFKKFSVSEVGRIYQKSVSNFTV